MGKARSNSACLLVGESSSGKTSLIATLAEKVYKDHGKKTLYYLVDGGGYGTQLEVLIEKGIVWVWKMRTRGEAFETCDFAAKGYWPKNWNPKTGESLPGGKLLPPITQEYKLYCSCGELANTKPKKDMLIKHKSMCPGCKTMLTLSTPNVRLEESLTRTKGLDDIGAVAYDGLTSMQQWIMDDLAHRAAQPSGSPGALKGEATGLGGVVVSGEFSAGGNNRAHYGFAQNTGEKWILNSTAIPELVAPPVWTALEERGQMSDTKVAVYGPKLAGGAKTSVAPQWVGNCLGLQVVQDKKKRNIHRLHLQEWMDEDNIPHLCKNRALPGLLPPYLEDTYDENGKIEYFKNFSLGTFFDLLDEALISATKKADEKFPNAPGLPTGSIGDDPADELVAEINTATKRLVAKGIPKASVRGARN